MLTCMFDSTKSSHIQTLVMPSSTSHLVYKDSRSRKVQVGKDQEKAQSEKDFHSKNRGGKKPN